jgi:hypothetical protein
VLFLLKIFYYSKLEAETMARKNWKGLEIEIIKDGEYYLATCEAFLMHGLGATEEEAFEDFKKELYYLKNELNGEGKFSEEWEEVREKLNRILAE